MNRRHEMLLLRYAKIQDYSRRKCPKRNRTELNVYRYATMKSLLTENDSKPSSVKTSFDKLKLKLVLICNYYEINYNFPYLFIPTF